MNITINHLYDVLKKIDSNNTKINQKIDELQEIRNDILNQASTRKQSIYENKLGSETESLTKLFSISRQLIDSISNIIIIDSDDDTIAQSMKDMIKNRRDMFQRMISVYYNHKKEYELTHRKKFIKVCRVIDNTIDDIQIDTLLNNGVDTSDIIYL